MKNLKRFFPSFDCPAIVTPYAEPNPSKYIKKENKVTSKNALRIRRSRHQIIVNRKKKKNKPASVCARQKPNLKKAESPSHNPKPGSSVPAQRLPLPPISVCPVMSIIVIIIVVVSVGSQNKRHLLSTATCTP